MKINLKKVNKVFMQLNIKDRPSFVLDVIKGYISRGTNGIQRELDEWEETQDIISNKETYSRIKNIKEQIAH